MILEPQPLSDAMKDPLGEDRCREYEEQRSYIWNIVMFFFLCSIVAGISALFNKDE